MLEPELAADMNESVVRPTANTPAIKTTIFIFSDTHGMPLDEYLPSPRADVAIHCGDLTEESKLAEMRTTLGLLKKIDAPLKLVLAGNHDFTLDTPSFKQKIEQARPPLEPALVTKEYGDYGEAEQLFAGAEEHGIHLLREGTHRFVLSNGAGLTVYASPYTQSLGDWGFQYKPDQGHVYDIEKGTDVAITHGPPRGVLDRTNGRERGGSSELFAAVAASRPRVHCFGHIHEGWGAKMVTWRGERSHQPSHLTDIDHGRSEVVETLSKILPGKYNTPEDVALKDAKLVKYREQRHCHTSHCHDDDFPLQAEKQTLFVNAAIKGGDDGLPVQFPWLVTLELPESEATKQKEAMSSIHEFCGKRGTEDSEHKTIPAKRKGLDR
ncbi:Ser/Thr protein phosphatase [Diaporthe helianthi]|uniref:Ser/Thr protein phosphatase n=1 Tax=Diaporthe helianthi TaxID=158607 RepID=A0A2P5HNN3_DIAHE|nr:Ser/Thr protein phosphatase [Diaporthe helianthi]